MARMVRQNTATATKPMAISTSMRMSGVLGLSVVVEWLIGVSADEAIFILVAYKSYSVFKHIK